MEVNRGGKVMKVRVNLEERTDEAMAMFTEGGGLFGATLVPMTPAIARKYGYQDQQSGLVVTRIEDGSSAAKAGLIGTSRVRGEIVLGDIIESVESTSVSSFDDLRNELEKFNVGDEVTLGVTRGGTHIYLKVMLELID